MKKNVINYEGIVKSKRHGDVMFIAPNWSFDKFRHNIKRLSKKGYFKVVTNRERKKGFSFGDYFERTDKKWIDGDAPNKSLRIFGC